MRALSFRGLAGTDDGEAAAVGETYGGVDLEGRLGGDGTSEGSERKSLGEHCWVRNGGR